MPRTFQRHWQSNIKVGKSYLVWFAVIIILLYAGGGVSQEFEGSTPSDEVTSLRLVESAGDEEIIVTNDRVCVRREFSGNGFRMQDTVYDHMFICPNGMIRFTNNVYQNWPYNYGTLRRQLDDPSLSPYWSLVDLNAFGTAANSSKVRFQTYHNVTNPRPVVFDKVNMDVRRAFTERNDFEATWVSVVTYQNIRPHDRVARGFQGKNTFQVVFASDETSWYLMYLYDDIDWAVGVPRAEYRYYVDQAGHPVMGWNFGRNGFDFRNNEEFQNLPLSGTVNAEDIDDFIGNLGRGRWIFATSPQRERTPRLLCYDWFIRAVPVTGLRRQQCPRFELQARFDRRFRNQNRFGRICYVRIFSRNGPGLRCCYPATGGALLENVPQPGGFLSRNPLFFDVDEDDTAFENCCVLSNLCFAYFNLRPKQNGRLYVPRQSAVGYGDPHYENLDGMEYTFNGCGEYMFVVSNDNTFQIQVRFSQVIGAGFGTVISAILLKIDGVAPIQINHNKNGGAGLLLHVNGTQNDDNSSTIGDRVSVERIGDNEIRLVTDEDHSLVVTREPENLVVVVTLDRSLFGKTMGLLGNWSDTMTDDFHLPNGTSLGFNLTDEQIHFDFGESWALSPSQNLFVNTTADEEFLCPESYTPIFLNNFTFPNSSIQAMAVSACQSNLNCLFDVAASLQVAFGETTLNSFNAFELEQNITENNAPTFEDIDVVFNLTVGEQFTYTTSAVDIDGDDLEFITTGLPDGATVERSGNNITFRWNVTTDSIQPFNISFLVRDSRNASSSLVPIIRVCACEDRDTCRQEATTIETQNLLFNQHQVLSCDCNLGFTGEFCEDVRDFCQTQSGSPCHPQTTCMNSPTGFTCGECPSGFFGDGITCTDIDECTSGNHDCEMRCINNAGGFDCACMEGYRLDDNMKNCSDIDECRTAHDCQQICVNEEGSFSCDCTENFMVNSTDARNCVPRNPCAENNNCEQICALDSNNEQLCSCYSGYTVDPDDSTKCIDIDECASSTNLCNQLCSNTMGSFTCSCLSGYEMEADRFTCQDIDECIMTEMLSCNTSIGGEQCVNLPGTFRCECNDNLGFVLIDGRCRIPEDGQMDIIAEPDEPPAATQEESASSVQLRLHDFQNDMYDRPTDIALRSSIATALSSYCNEDDERRDECGLPGHGFQFSESNIFRVPNGTIQDGNDTLVSYYAIYPNGLLGDQRVPVPRSILLSALNARLAAVVASTGVNATIEDIDECMLNIDGCEQMCTNTPGSFVCSCLIQGYQLHSNMTACIDINECATQADNCNQSAAGQICRNIPRSFVCECNRTMGFGLINGICQALNGSLEMPPEPRNATMNQTDSAVALIIPDFQIQQYDAQTDTQLRAAIAEALNNYCNVNATRRTECRLPVYGFEFNEQDIHRIPSDPTQDGSDTLISIYALYPNGALFGMDIPVPQQVLSNAIQENLDSIRDSTGLESLSLDEDTTPSDDEPFDFALVLGLSLAGALFALMGIAVCCLCCRGYFGAGAKKRSRRPMQFVYDAYRHRPRRRLPNVADLDPSFGTFHSMSGETYSGFDEDGLPVDIQTDYDGLSRQARTVSHVPTLAGSRAPTLAGSRAPTLAGSRAPSLAGSRAPTLAGSRAPTFAGSRAPTSAGSRAPTLAGSRASIR